MKCVVRVLRMEYAARVLRMEYAVRVLRMEYAARVRRESEPRERVVRVSHEESRECVVTSVER